MAKSPGSSDVTEEELLRALGLDRSQIPNGFRWSASDAAWVRSVRIDPSGTAGMRVEDAEQLALLVADFNNQLGHQALRVYFSDSGASDGPLL